jgi:hypothetical protein
MRATYWPSRATRTPIDCEIIDVRPDGIVCRELDKLWPGVFLAPRGTVRRVSDVKVTPAEVIDPVAQRLLNKLRRAGVA